MTVLLQDKSRCMPTELKTAPNPLLSAHVAMVYA